MEQLDNPQVPIGTGHSREIMSSLEELENIYGCILETHPECVDENGELIGDIKELPLDYLQSIVDTCDTLTEICKKYINS